MNKMIPSLSCIRCGAVVPLWDYPEGCPHCRAQGENISLEPDYEGKFVIDKSKRGMFRYTSRLPYDDFPTLGEGGTPVIELTALSQQLGLAKLYSKNEFQNPTGSHKDRMNPFVVRRAMEVGCTTVAAASTGNEGVSLACYAAAAGMNCCIVSTDSISPIWKSAILSTGAQLLLTDRPAERLALIDRKRKEENWYSATNLLTPPTGSCLYGVQGYKTISYELYEDFGRDLPEYIFVPTTRGDLLWGIYRGLQELLEAALIDRFPRLVAVEPAPRLERVLRGESLHTNFACDAKLTSSIGGSTATFQSLQALSKTNGFAVSFEQNEVMPAVLELGGYGLYLETASAAALCALRKALRQGNLAQGARVLIISTSHGYKNPPQFYENESWSSKIQHVKEKAL